MPGALDLSRPFILFDDARSNAAAQSRLYRKPKRILSTSDPKLVPGLIRQLEGGDWAGFITYEVGAALEPKLSVTQRNIDLPLLWFGLFEGYETLEPGAVEALLPDPDGGWLGKPEPLNIFGDYARAFNAVKNYISAGDIYQANLSFPSSVPVAGHPLALYAGLRKRALAGYCALVWTGKDWLLSLSPELFFAARRGKITTKPMKGTVARKRDLAADAEAARMLPADPKQRAENLMIVDLLRNDLSRVAEHGSVEVPELFKVETYPTIHTMTSTVTAQLKPTLQANDVLGAIFPCGSITGAPKIRAMEVIHEVEQRARGAYTGAIGRIDANGDAAFNVAIRTLHLRDGAASATLGLGGGIVADSQMEEEWRECLAKGRFVADKRTFDLLETMRFEPEQGIAYLERHLNRLKESARTFGFAFDRHLARNELQVATLLQIEPCRVRLALSPNGQFAIELTALHPHPPEPVAVALAPLPVDPSDFRLRHKTSDRLFYTQARAACGAFEVVFVDAEGFVTEGSFTNIFVERNGVMLTPPLARGLLPGVLRQELIDTGKAQEAELTPDDLKEGVHIGNASRGLIAAKLT